MVKHGISRTPNTLTKRAFIGGGPVFQKDGRIHGPRLANCPSITSSIRRRLMVP
jgi:hypothetical protein